VDGDGDSQRWNSTAVDRPVDEQKI